MKRVLITGANGLLGQALVNRFKEDYQLLASGQEEQAYLTPAGWEYISMDIMNRLQLKEAYQNFEPDYVLNAASYTNVDACENDKELCWQINVKGVENLAELARRYHSHLIHYSTDYLFDGDDGPYDENARPNPLGYYGNSKLASENVLLQIGCIFTVLRTCVLYGTGLNVKRNFFLWVWENLAAGNKITVVTDQYNNPTLADDLAMASGLVLDRNATGIFNIAGKEYLNRFEFALQVAEIFNFSKDLIIPIDTSQLKQTAHRPLRGGLKIDLALEELGYDPRTVRETLIYLKWKMENHG
jgi:dTDP-4-dehydrorhamnose reductase